ncbi:hypothetical protein BSKO_10521 [Bryopsis sp. KO-2023]|nr:hypothetical protein BSKO_10521 [Bryopsis sp. KO-2023]
MNGDTEGHNGYSNGYGRSGRGDRFGGGGRFRGGEGGGGFMGRGGGRGRGNPEQGWQSSEAGMAAITRALENLQLAATPQQTVPGVLAKRPDSGGSSGRRMALFANHFIVNCSATQAFHYDLEIKPIFDNPLPDGMEPSGPQLLPITLCKEIVTKCAQENCWPEGKYAFDGKKNVFTPEEFLAKGKQEFEVMVPGNRKERKFRVTTQLASIINLMDLCRYIKQSDIVLPQDCIQALEVALRFGASMMPNCFSAGRSLYFDDRVSNKSLPGGAELWLGYHQSVKPCQMGLTLNIDTTAGAFLTKRCLVDVMMEAAGVRDIHQMARGMSDQQIRKMKKAVCGLMVITTHREGRNQKRKVKGLTKGAARDLMFQSQDGKSQSVAQYWESAYGPLKLDFLPCLDVSRGPKINYLPPEVCEVVPGQRQTKLTDMQTREIITFAAKKPHERKAGIERALGQSGITRDGVTRNFGIDVQNRMVELEGRVLPQPHLEYTRPGSLDTGTRGAWNLEGIQFLEGGTIKGWGIVNFEREDRAMGPGESGLRGFVDGLRSTLKDLGLTIPEEPPVLTHGNPRQNPVGPMEACLRQAENQFGEVTILLVLLPFTDSGFYRAVKHAGNSTLGIPTQCFVASKAGIGCQPRGRLQYLANLGMKINHKVGGVNTQLAGKVQDVFPVVGNQPFIVFGADVTHPTGFDEREPSVAALVASMDPAIGQYATRIIVQGHRQELIDMKEPVKDLLKCFYQRCGLKPERIVFYRDGVSEGQFQQCLHHEYSQIRQACQELEENYRPPISFIVVQKRHHTRLFPQNSREGDRNGNVVPGTIVDSGIVGPKDFEFFLNSQAGIQGTNKPAHYRVLVDENGFGSDGIQLMTYWMCFLYCRCTRSVSYAPPAYYAHLAAMQGKLLIQESSSDGTESIDGQERAKINAKIENSMFFV